MTPLARRLAALELHAELHAAAAAPSAQRVADVRQRLADRLAGMHDRLRLNSAPGEPPPVADVDPAELLAQLRDRLNGTDGTDVGAGPW